MFTKDVVKLRDFALKVKLAMPKELKECPAEELRKKNFYNGAGPDWFPEWARWLSTLFLWLFAAAVMIHDWHFHHSDKRLGTFNQVNKEFYNNMIKIVEYYFGGWLFGWCGALYNYWATKAWLAWLACKEGGWSAWIDDSTNKKEEEKGNDGKG